MTDLSSRRSALSAAKRSLLEERLRGVIKTSARKCAIQLRTKEGSAPLSYAQRRLWFLDQLAPTSPFYNTPGAIRLEGKLNLEALERAINEIVRRHEVLRTRFEVENGEPVQLIDEWEPRRLEIEDLKSVAREEREAEVRRIAREEAETRFDLSQGPLLRVKALKLEEKQHVVLFTMHHIVSDGWSVGVLIGEVRALYDAYSAGESSPLEELPIDRKSVV